ncbi:hypothetical protein JOD21_002419, partial [Jeotgalibacillus terrae]|nr:hypothetical protein [Jeotgalibacillus terrae]
MNLAFGDGVGTTRSDLVVPTPSPKKAAKKTPTSGGFF